MNNSTDSSGDIGGLAYGLGITVGVLTMIIVITLVSYFCAQVQESPNSQSIANSNTTDHRLRLDIESGIDEATLRNYPTLLYSENKAHHDSLSSCSICLGDYKDADMLRLLPDCGHVFHLKCIDPWLRLHPTCPMCRNSPLPSPLSTPLAEVAPLARH